MAVPATCCLLTPFAHDCISSITDCAMVLWGAAELGGEGFVLLQVLVTVSSDGPAVAACLSLWDESLLAVASLHVVKAYKFDIRTGTHKSSNAMMLVSNCRLPAAST